MRLELPSAAPPPAGPPADPCVNGAPAGRLERFALAMTAIAERWIPDAFVFALVGTGVVLALAWAQGAGVGPIVKAWGDGFWSLVPFTLQMAMIVIGGTIVAIAPPVQRAIDVVARWPATARQGTVLVAVVSMTTSWINWGFGLLISAFLARATARTLAQRGVRVDYRMLCAMVLVGLGTVWAQGLSGSAALQMATPGMLPAGLRAVIAGRDPSGHPIVPGGGIGLRDTIFLWQSFASVAIEIAVVSVVVAWMTPGAARARTAADLGVDLTPPPPAADSGPRLPGQWLEHQAWLGRLVGALGAASIGLSLWSAPHFAAAVTLNTINLSFLVVAMLLHGSPARLQTAFRQAAPATSGLLLQFPFYGAIAQVMTDTRLSERIAHLFTDVATPATYPALVALYSAVLGVFVPSGGSKWVIEAPYVIGAAHALHVHLGWMVAVYDLGEALANLVQPFWMVPVLGLLGVRARDVMGVTWALALVLLPLVLALVTAFGLTLSYPLGGAG